MRDEALLGCKGSYAASLHDSVLYKLFKIPCSNFPSYIMVRLVAQRGERQEQCKRGLLYPNEVRFPDAMLCKVPHG